MRFLRYLALALVLLYSGCAYIPHKPVRTYPPPKAYERPAAPGLCRIPSDQAPFLVDDLDQPSLEVAVNRSIQYFNRLTDKTTFNFGKERYTVQEMKESLQTFLAILRSPIDDAAKEKKIREQFAFYKSSGRENGSRVLFTGYFEPVLDGSLKKTDRYKYPVYRLPDDMVFIDLGKFKDKYKGEKIVGRLAGSELIPYYNRREIVTDGSLENKGLELVWLADPIDAFYLHIQGSGLVKLPNGKTLQIGYAGGNGKAYCSIGRYLLDSGKIMEKDISHRRIKQYLREHPEEMDSILNQNQSFVFFRIVENGPVGSLGAVVTAGRTIATDPEFFPKGALSFIRLRKPVLDNKGEVTSWVDFSRFTLNQDSGGAIKGPGRVDIFCGRGETAEQIAGSIKEEGDLYFLVKKK